MSEQQICAGCGRKLDGEESFSPGGRTLCEDCYLLASHRVQTCDPLAVRSALSARKALNIGALEGLTARQRSIRDYIESKGKVRSDQLISTLGLSSQELERDLAVLRHCELVKGLKEGDDVYLVLF